MDLGVLVAVVLELEELDQAGNWGGGIGVGSSADEIAVVFCHCGAGGFVGGPVGFLTGGAAV